MTIRNTCIALVAAALLVACSDGHGSSSSGGNDPGAQTVTQAASAQISFSTTDTSQPIEPNNLTISGADTNETSSPESVN
jgi:hypothetical protein